MHGVLLAAEGKRRGFVMLGIAIGMGVLTKGPVILLNLLPITVLAPWWSPGLKWSRWFGGVVLAVLLGAGIALVWALPAGMAGGEAYRNAIFWGQTADRMVDSFAHRRPLWWYLPLLPVLLFPWFVWPGMWQALARQRRAGRVFASPGCCRYSLRFPSSVASSHTTWFHYFRRLLCWRHAFWQAGQGPGLVCQPCWLRCWGGR
jgi:4-amino-4-deoxy-L-arabinose transferase-like glycosyltransferase